MPTFKMDKSNLKQQIFTAGIFLMVLSPLFLVLFGVIGLLVSLLVGACMALAGKYAE
jgi:hypothetical protein